MQCAPSVTQKTSCANTEIADHNLSSIGYLLCPSPSYMLPSMQRASKQGLHYLTNILKEQICANNFTKDTAGLTEEKKKSYIHKLSGY